VISMEVKQPGRVTITQGDWITVKGHRMEILPHEWRLDKLKKVGEDVDVKGLSVKLG